MKNKIALKLTLYFSMSLLLFSLIIGSVFMTLFKNQTIHLHKVEMEKRAVSIAGTLSTLISNSNAATDTRGNAAGKGGMSGAGGMGGMMHGMGMGMGGMMQGMGGYSSYLQFLDKIAMADVWIVDESLQLMTIGHMTNRQINYADLPADADQVVKEVFQGRTTFSEGFSSLLNTPTLTVGAPIKAGDNVVGALLLHSPIQGTKEALRQGAGILAMSIGTALLLSLLLSILLAYTFTKPLNRMKNSTLQLAKGDYLAKTGVQQKDDIGELASAIDILSERLELASHESERLEQQRRDFIANISHELRTPVTVIRGSLEALCDEVIADPDQIKDYHRQMLNESIFLQRLVNDLLDLTRLQNPDFKMEMEEINLGDLLRDVIRSAQNIARSKDIVLKTELDQDAPLCSILGDYVRLRQMFLIILDNAIKFSPLKEEVWITFANNTVTIRDKGIGIALEDLPHIFDRFYKSKAVENKTGTGLGLAIAKQIADRHTIRVSVESQPNLGTQFSFHFKCISPKG
ncbi:signal transduction histidine kinase [Desulfitobacterium dehalogenans ATCC 51507]|uniref:histidine kinase n=1 Tax=Desulfitobacterium dehalogenans (strain ATCC 51507 / DSM 9161 / JW/IU-DC1) TaxID=756499 RepID=I4A8C7_DESDJ|nr:HAMP domain-containing sensor histidine kinase [Desulfitobacterium dehalogenans]AFM00212.1 signal transduction histidine kinase [Desulfitobacterium dehalogenans ATCC 51507]